MLPALLIGQADGHVKIFLNIATDAAPAFDAGTFVQAGPAGTKTDISISTRAIPMQVTR